MSDARAEALRRLQRARASLVLEHPRLGEAAARLALADAEAPRPATIALADDTIHFDPDWVLAQAADTLAFAVAHLALHAELGHAEPGAHRDLARWGSACDRVIDALLAEAGLRPPPGVPIDPAAAGVSVDRVYAGLAPGQREAGLDEHWFLDPARRGESEGETASGGAPRPEAGEERAEDSEPGREAPPVLHERAAREGRASGAGHGFGSGAPWRRLDARPPGAPRDWRRRLDRHLVRLARTDFTYLRPSRRSTDDYLLPALSQHRLDLVVGLDISASVPDEDLAAFLHELEAIKGQIHARITLHACDNRLAAGGPWISEPGQPLEWPSLQGRGGTDFRPVFDWIERRGGRPDCLLYCTDGDGRYPGRAPPFPVIWLVTGRRTPPWGEVVRMHDPTRAGTAQKGPAGVDPRRW